MLIKCFEQIVIRCESRPVNLLGLHVERVKLSKIFLLKKNIIWNKAKHDHSVGT